MKTQYEILEEEIINALSQWKEGEELSLDERLKKEVFLGNNILRWARQGFLKLDEEALKKRF